MSYRTPIQAPSSMGAPAISRCTTASSATRSMRISTFAIRADSPSEITIRSTRGDLSRRAAPTIQPAINNAIQSFNGQRPVIHFAAGDYGITSTITIPANSDVQLVGDGHRTHLSWTGSGTGPVIYIKGPTHATLREMNIDGNG